MKVLQVSNKIPLNPKDGGALAMNNILTGFLNNDINVDVLSMNTTKHYISKENLNELIPENLNFYTVTVNNNINLIKLILNLIFSRLPYNLTRFISGKFKSRLIDILNENKYDIIHLEGLYVCTYIKTIRKYSDATISYRAHNIESRIWENNVYNEKNILRKFYLKVLKNRLLKYEEFVINKYDALIPITSIDLDFFEQKGNTKPFIIIPFGIDFFKYTVTLNNQISKHSLFYIGSLDWIPNIEGLKWFIEEVWNDLKNNFPELSFRVAGRNADKKLVHFLLKNNIEYLGEISDSKSIFLDNSLMIVPLFSGSGMRVKIIEGMAYGKVIISTKKGIEGINCDEGKNILIADSGEDFIQKITEILKNDDLYSKISINARELVKEEYNNNDIINRLINFYKQIKI